MASPGLEVPTAQHSSLTEYVTQENLSESYSLHNYLVKSNLLSSFGSRSWILHHLRFVPRVELSDWVELVVDVTGSSTHHTNIQEQVIIEEILGSAMDVI